MSSRYWTGSNKGAAALAFCAMAWLSSCVSNKPIANQEQSFAQPVVISVIGDTARIQLMSGYGLSGPAYFPEVPEWGIDEAVEAEAVRLLRARGIDARGGGAALRARVAAIAGYKKGNALDLHGVRENLLDDAVRQLGLTGADSVLFISGGVQPLPVGAVRLLSDYGMCEVADVPGTNCTFVFGPARGFAYANPSGAVLGSGIQKSGGLRTLPRADFPFAASWATMPAGQKARLKEEVKGCFSTSLREVLGSLGLQ